MVTRLDEHIPAISTVREKRSRECSNYVMRRRIPGSTISRNISICRCKRRRHGLQQPRAKRTKRLTCCGVLRMPKTFWASIQFHLARLFPFANNSAVSSLKWANQNGDKENAHRYYAQLAAQSAKAVGSRDELNHVREFLTAQAKAKGPSNVSVR